MGGVDRVKTRLVWVGRRGDKVMGVGDRRNKKRKKGRENVELEKKVEVILQNG